MAVDIASELDSCDSYNRIPMLLRLYQRILDAPPGREFNTLIGNWFNALGRFWSTCTLITPYAHHLQGTIGKCDDMSLLLMTETERAAFYEMPEVVTVYRGCGRPNARGICWSLDPEAAIRFPFQGWYKESDPILITATVQWDDIVAVKWDQGEAVVITFMAKEQSRGSLLPIA
jgi:hypothetical protein